jgi:hypothetical protein
MLIVMLKLDQKSYLYFDVSIVYYRSGARIMLDSFSYLRV